MKGIGPLIADSGDDSLIDVLTRRLNDEYALSADDSRTASYIIGNIDSNGYLARPLASIADDLAIVEGLEVSDSDIRRVADMVRSLDPAGICATDLRDCLLLQLARKENSLGVRIAREILSDCFDLFSKKHFEQIRARLGVTPEAMREALDIIRSLNPKPGALIGSSPTLDRMQHIIPDFNVEYEGGDRFTVSLLSSTPELSIEESFRSAPDDGAPAGAQPESAAARRRAEASAFIRRKHDEAAAFIRMLELRSQTLLSVMKAITSLQKAFFISGEKADIRPMILKDVAAATGLDISVISRATTSKYVMTPHGIYPLKLFFNERPMSDTDTSSHEISQAISELIAAEDKCRPLSDEVLKSLLEKRGYDIARRTVAKYRERLGIPVARLRKQF